MRIHGFVGWAVLGLGAAAGGCWTADSAPARSTEAVVGGEEEAARSAAPAAAARAERPLTLAEPLTLRLAPAGELARAIRGLSAGDAVLPTLRLTLRGLETPEAEVAIRVFVNDPGASLDSPIDGPRFAGEVGFHPTTWAPGAGEIPESTFLLDVGRLLAALPPDERLVDGRFLDVTLVARPLREGPAGGAADEAVIRLDGVELSLHRPD